MAGKPSPEALAKLKEQGFKTVIDLRMETEGTAEEKAIVEGQGLRYVSVPMSAATFKLEDAEAVGRILPMTPRRDRCCCTARPRTGWAGCSRSWKRRRASRSTKRSRPGQKAGLKNGPMIEAVKRVLAAPEPKP